MKITDALLGEHGVFYVFFKTLAEKVQAGDATSVQSLAEALDHMVRAHAAAEDDLLFPAIEAAMGGGGPVAVMRAEHREIDDILDDIRAADDAGLFGPVGELTDLLEAHFAKEEAVLFHLAQQFIDAAALDDMGRRWAERRAVRLDAEGCAA